MAKQSGQTVSMVINRTSPVVGQNEDLDTKGYWVDESEIAYIKVPGFGEPQFEESALKLVGEFKSARTIIVDVRGNSGGSTPEKLVKILMDRPWRWGISTSPLQVGILQHQGNFNNSHLLWAPSMNTPEDEAFQGNLIILIDRSTGSAAEDFVIPFKDNGRATLMGECTFGSTGQPVYHEFENDISIRVSTKRDSMPDGSTFEGIGIAPDLPISMTRRDFYSTRDAILDKAIEHARQG